MRMDEIEKNLNIPKEDLFDLYTAGKELEQSQTIKNKTAKELFQEKLDLITKEDLKVIGNFLTENPPTIDTFAHVSELNVITSYSIHYTKLYDNYIKNIDN